MRPAGRTVLLLALVVTAAMPQARASSQVAGLVQETPHFFVVKTGAPFDEVLTSLREAVKRKNYALTGVNDMDDTLARRAADIGGPPLPYERYKIVGFCSLTLADEGLRLSPDVGAFFPCRAVVFKARGAAETTVVAFRPMFLVTAVDTPGIERILRQAEADVLEILGEVAADSPR